MLDAIIKLQNEKQEHIQKRSDQLPILVFRLLIPQSTLTNHNQVPPQTDESSLSQFKINELGSSITQTEFILENFNDCLSWIFAPIDDYLRWLHIYDAVYEYGGGIEVYGV